MPRRSENGHFFDEKGEATEDHKNPIVGYVNVVYDRAVGRLQ